jgi:hypothetical protein
VTANEAQQLPLRHLGGVQELLLEGALLRVSVRDGRELREQRAARAAAEARARALLRQEGSGVSAEDDAATAQPAGQHDNNTATSANGEAGGVCEGPAQSPTTEQQQPLVVVVPGADEIRDVAAGMMDDMMQGVEELQVRKLFGTSVYPFGWVLGDSLHAWFIWMHMPDAHLPCHASGRASESVGE